MLSHHGVLDKTTAWLEVQMENGESSLERSVIYPRIYHWNARWASWLVTTTSAPTPAPLSSRTSASSGGWRWSPGTTRETSGPVWTFSHTNYLAPSWFCWLLWTWALCGSWRTNLSSALWLTITSVPASSREEPTLASRESSGSTLSTCKFHKLI